MAVATLTVNRIKPAVNAKTERMKAAAAGMTPGQLVYISSYSEDVPVATIADADALASAQAVGIIVAISGQDKTSSEAGDILSVVTIGRVSGFSGLTAGALYYVSITEGKMNVAQDAIAGDYVFYIGRAFTDTILHVFPFTTSLDVVV